ncbi:MAG: O-antigen ligase family protein [Desulfosoma sp.]
MVAQFTFALRAGENPRSATDSLNFANFLRIFLVSSSLTWSSLILLLNAKSSFLSLLRICFLGFLFYAVTGTISGSYASHPFYAIWKSIELAASILAAITAVSIPTEDHLVTFNEVVIGVLYLLFFSVCLGAIVFPQRAFIPSRGIFSYMLQGAILPINPNSVGLIAALVAIHTFSSLLNPFRMNTKISTLLRLFFALIILILSQSRTSLIGFSVASILLMLLYKRMFLLILCSIIGFSLFFLGYYDFIVAFVMRGQSRDLFLSFSGRTYMWKTAWTYFLKSPFIGHGLASAGRFDLLGGGPASTLHGTFVEVAVGTGIVGFSFWIIALVAGCVAILKASMMARQIILNNPNPTSSQRISIIAIQNCALAMAIGIRSLTSSDLALYSLGFLMFIAFVAQAHIYCTVVKSS